MRRANAIPVWEAVFVASVFVILFFSISGPVAAQTTNPLVGQTAFIEDDDGDETVDTIGPIAVAGCEADPNATASLTIADGNGNEATFTDGDNAAFRFGSDGITITAPVGGTLEVPNNFRPGTGEVLGSTGITCGNEPQASNNGDQGSNDPDGTQYGPDDPEITVIIETIPDKPLPNTGGIPLVVGAGALLACATLLSVRLLRP